MKQSHQSNKTSDNELYVIGVGASAGGLEALTKFLSGFNGHTHNIAIVVVQHLNPDHKTELPHILSKYCRWPVHTITDGMQVLPHHVYVTPENKRVTYQPGHTLKLEDIVKGTRHNPCIDDFLASLAEVEKEQGIAVILSGSGIDGASGIRQAKKYGGLTVAQHPDTAQFGDMPHAAIQTQVVDIIAHPSKMCEEITYYIKNRSVIHNTSDKQKSIDVIFELLSKRSGTDFSQYKPNTIMRRLDKRIEALGLTSAADYYQWIRNNPAELDTLFDTVLIGVTEFFRDTEAFRMLEQQLRASLEEKRFSDTIRIWCVGCATGEEPYSIAILIHELLQDKAPEYHIQIFATDIDERALNTARKGIYSGKSLEKIAPALREKYFEATEHGFEIKKQIKQHVLFSRHDITNDPPFVKLDVVICRNLLIYFNNHLQREVLRIFNYAMKPDGLLFLGKSESVSVANELFEKIEGSKLFKKTHASSQGGFRFSRFKIRAEKNEAISQVSRHQSLIDIAKDTLYYANEHPFVIVNEQGDIKETQGSLRLYMEVGKGGGANNVLKMANGELVMEIRSLIAQAKKTKAAQAGSVIRFNLFEKDHFVRLKLTPLLYPSANVHYYLLVFEAVPPDNNYIRFSDKLSRQEMENFRIRELEQEVMSLREHLQTFTEELETTNEEMQAINEELQSANEELKSANEELETSNEELQSANEELNTSNQELRFSNTMLIEKENELKESRMVSEQNALLYRSIAENLPNGTIGVLNNQFEIEYMAGKGLHVHKMKLGDLRGKVLHELNPSKQEREKLRQAFLRTISGETCALEFSYQGRIYSLNTVPLRYESSETKIMFLTQDITQKIENESLIRQSEEKFRMLADNMPNICWIANADGWIYWYNSRWYEYTGTTLQQMKGWGWQSVHDPKVLPTVLEKWTESIATGKFFEMTFPLRGRDGEFRTFLTRIFPVVDQNGNVQQWLGTNTDISAQQMEADKLEHIVSERTKDLVRLNAVLEKKNLQLQQAQEFLQLVIDSSVEYISVLDTEMRYMLVNKKFEELIKVSHAKEVIGKKITEVIPGIADTLEYDGVVRALAGDFIHLNKRADLIDPNMCVDIHIVPFGTKGTHDGIIIMARDITNLHQAEKMLEVKNAALNKSNENLQQFAFVASHDLKEPIRKIEVFASMIIRNYTDELDQTVKNYISRIQSAASRMIDMVDGLLVYSSTETIDEPIRPVNLNDVFHNILNDLELLIEEKRAVITVSKLPVVQGVADLLYQFFVNIINNALKFSKEDTPPVIDVHAQIYQDKNQEMAKIVIRDNGIGFAKEDSEKIFKTFVRLNSKSRYEGSGLGLALCKRIADFHRGTVYANGIPDKGAEFVFIMPVKHEH